MPAPPHALSFLQSISLNLVIGFLYVLVLPIHPMLNAV